MTPQQVYWYGRTLPLFECHRILEGGILARGNALVWFTADGR